MTDDGLLARESAREILGGITTNENGQRAHVHNIWSIRAEDDLDTGRILVLSHYGISTSDGEFYPYRWIPRLLTCVLSLLYF